MFLLPRGCILIIVAAVLLASILIELVCIRLTMAKGSLCWLLRAHFNIFSRLVVNDWDYMLLFIITLNMALDSKGITVASLNHLLQLFIRRTGVLRPVVLQIGFFIFDHESL